jgi:hypothetical protein
MDAQSAERYSVACCRCGSRHSFRAKAWMRGTRAQLAKAEGLLYETAQELLARIQLESATEGKDGRRGGRSLRVRQVT